METRHFAVASGLVRPTAITSNRAWIVTAVTETLVDNTSAWKVVAAYQPGGGCAVDTQSAPLLTIIQSDTPLLYEEAFPHTLSISSDDVLAVALGVSGVRLFLLVPPVGTAPMVSLALHTLTRVQGSALSARFIGPSKGEIPNLVVWTRNSRDHITVHGDAKNGTVKRVELLSANGNGVREFDAHTPGHVAVLSNHEMDLHILVRQTTGCFKVSTISLYTLHEPMDSMTLSLTALAIGDELVVVGFDTKSGGLVEAFDVEKVEMVTRRTIPGKGASCLATDGPRILVGTSALSSLNAHLSALYAITVDNDATFVVCPGEASHPRWCNGTVHVDKASWCYARTLNHPVNNSPLVVVDHARVSPVQAQLARAPPVQAQLAR